MKKTAKIFILFVLTFILTSSNFFSQCLEQGEIKNETPKFLSRGECHQYTINAPENEYLEIVVEQQGVDLELKISEDNRQIKSADSSNDNTGEEIILVISPRNSKYQLRIISIDNHHENFYKLNFKRQPATAEDFVFVERFNQAQDYQTTANQKHNESLYLESETLYLKAAEIYKSVSVKRFIKYRLCLNNYLLGSLYKDLKMWEKSSNVLQENVKLAEELNEPYLKALSLAVLGTVYQKSNEFDESRKVLALAVDYLESLAEKNLGNSENLPNTYLNYANLLNSLGKKDKALEILQKLASKYQKYNNQYLKGITLLADIYLDLENRKLAEETLKANLPNEIEADTLGHFYKVKGKLFLKNDKFQSLKFFNLSLLAFKENEAEQASVKLFIGNVYFYHQDYKTAKHYYRQSQIGFEKFGDDENLAQVLNNLGLIFYHEKDLLQAETFCQNALQVNIRIDNKLNQARNLLNLMHFQLEKENYVEFVLYGKLALNLFTTFQYQNLRNLEDESKQNFRMSFTDNFRELADVLIRLQRIFEAEQVLYFIKEKEYYDFVEGNEKLTSIPLNQEEIKLFENLKLNIKIENSLQNFSPHQKLINNLMSAEENTSRILFVSVIVAQKAISLIVTSEKKQDYFRIPISREKLRRLVSNYHETIIKISPQHKIKGNLLYHYLVKPLEKTLAINKPVKVVWFLDDVLRAVPIAAIFDGKQFLTQRFANLQLTLVSYRKISLPRRENLWAIGLASSESFENLPILDQSISEIECIIADNKKLLINSPCEKGIIKGRKFADDEFTKELLEDAFNNYEIIHIASHFVMKSGSYKDSFLLLGGGNNRKYYVEQFSKQNLEKVEMLTFSACDTANLGFSGSFESIANMAQKQGAKSVLGTLWSVEDSSTVEFMTQFYHFYQNKNLDKAESLQEVQKNFLKGKKHSHPFYWSAFVIYGNWK